MSVFHKIINALDKISAVVLVWCLSYMEYSKEKYVASIIALIFSFVFLVVLLKDYKSKPWGNKVMDIFLVVMLIGGFVDGEYNDEFPLYFGVVGIITVLIDLVFFLYIDYCDIKQRIKSKDIQQQSEYHEYEK